MAKNKNSDFKFRKHDKIGSEDAEHDREWLDTCFFDNGHISVLRNLAHKERIILGRTGSGKTALIDQIQRQEEHSYKVDLESLSLNLIQGSTIIQSLQSIGVNLDIFYRLLWRHVFASELIAIRFQDDPDFKAKGYVSRKWESIAGKFTKNAEREAKKRALEYLERWGNNFFSETHERIREVVDRFEADITSKLKASGLPGLSSELTARANTSEQQRREIESTAQAIVNKIQIAELSRVIEILNDDIIPDGGRKYYILIDKLDEKWVDDKIRYELIRALIETVRDFAKIRSTKIVVALRRDLYLKTIRLTRGSGFQEEKYNSFILNLDWSRSDLMSLADKRINELVRRTYTKQTVSYKDLFPRQIGRRKIDEYLIERTHYRPRDTIVLLNGIISKAADSPKISTEHVKQAMSDYSRDRFRSLGTEWYDEYPKLLDFCDILKGQQSSYYIKDIDLDRFEEICTSVCIHDEDGSGQLASKARKVLEKASTPQAYQDLLLETIHVFYTTGIVGLKLSPTSPIIWSFRDKGTVSKAELTPQAKVHTCPMLWHVLGANYTD